MRHLRVAAVLVVPAVAVEPPVNRGEYLVGLVDQAEIERRCAPQTLGALGAARVLPPR